MLDQAIADLRATANAAARFELNLVAVSSAAAGGRTAPAGADAAGDDRADADRGAHVAVPVGTGRDAEGGRERAPKGGRGRCRSSGPSPPGPRSGARLPPKSGSIAATTPCRGGSRPWRTIAPGTPTCSAWSACSPGSPGATTLLGRQRPDAINALVQVGRGEARRGATAAPRSRPVGPAGAGARQLSRRDQRARSISSPRFARRSRTSSRWPARRRPRWRGSIASSRGLSSGPP